MAKQELQYYALYYMSLLQGKRALIRVCFIHFALSVLACFKSLKWITCRGISCARHLLVLRTRANLKMPWSEMLMGLKQLTSVYSLFGWTNWGFIWHFFMNAEFSKKGRSVYCHWFFRFHCISVNFKAWDCQVTGNWLHNWVFCQIITATNYFIHLAGNLKLDNI